jgi:hypothetical protein
MTRIAGAHQGAGPALRHTGLRVVPKMRINAPNIRPASAALNPSRKDFPQRLFCSVRLSGCVWPLKKSFRTTFAATEHIL